MDPTTALLVAALLVTALLTAVLVLRPPGTDRLRRVARRHWRAQRHLWDVVLAEDGWSPRGR